MIPAWVKSAGIADAWVNLALVAVGIALSALVIAWFRGRER